MEPVENRFSVSLKRILFPSDLSSYTDGPATYVKAIATRFASTVEIVHVFDPSIHTSFEDECLRPTEPTRRDQQNQELERTRKEFVADGVNASAFLLQGEPVWRLLVEASKTHEADLIVVGTQAHSALSRFALGSTTEQLMRHAELPVLTVGPEAERLARGPLAFKSIVYATDFSPTAIKAALFALAFAEDSAAHLYLCHVRDPQVETTEAAGRSEESVRAALKRAIPESAYEWCSPEAMIEYGEASEKILDIASTVDADLIVLGIRSSSFWLTHVERGVSLDVLTHAKCPVLTVC